MMSSNDGPTPQDVCHMVIEQYENAEEQDIQDPSLLRFGLEQAAFKAGKALLNDDEQDGG